MNRRRVAVRAGLAALVAWLAFAALTAVVVSGHGAPLRPDRGLLSWSVGHRPPDAVAVARGLTATGTGIVPYALMVLAGLVVGRTARERVTAVLLAMACLGLGQTLRYDAMDLIRRARPPRSDWQTHASGWSYPSGHTTTAALTAGLLILALWARSPRGRAALCALAACWGAAVGLTRVFLGVHWFTDVVGGWLFAVGWLGLLLALGARWGPARFLPGGVDATGPGDGPAEEDAAQQSGRRG
ncbi:phosphatase PAP2 family protein, partial [Streptomyces sp. AF1A]|uniref:phosphatase PAP2 family protein n=1 Tax=Streptomyces sp. AF1A TaxID=3394350 RepID=UPI0039BD7471